MPAIVYVPGKLVTGVVFVEDPTDVGFDDPYPHITLAYSDDWTTKMSNQILEATLSSEKAFDFIYQKLDMGTQE